MRSAIIADGIVTNVIMGSLPESIACENEVGIGWSYDGVNFIPPAPEPPTAGDIRAERNYLLAASDWTQVADTPVDQAAWATYRQALREVPEQAGFPANVIWPQTP
jgi:hypothetical protein